MDNPETQVALGIQHIEQSQAKKKVQHGKQNKKA